MPKGKFLWGKLSCGENTALQINTVTYKKWWSGKLKELYNRSKSRHIYLFHFTLHDHKAAY